MLLLLLIYVVLRALWKIDIYLISTLVNKSLYYYYVYDLRRIVSIQNTLSSKLWWKVGTYMRCVTCECYSKQDACETCVGLGEIM